MIDLDKAEAVLRSARVLALVWPVDGVTGVLCRAVGKTARLTHRRGGVACAVNESLATVTVTRHTLLRADEADALAAAITRAAALCRRIEAECQKTEAP